MDSENYLRDPSLVSRAIAPMISTSSGLPDLLFFAVLLADSLSAVPSSSHVPLPAPAKKINLNSSVYYNKIDEMINHQLLCPFSSDRETKPLFFSAHSS